MENRRKLLVAFSWIVGVLVLVYAFVQSNAVDYPIGLGLLIAGIAFLICAK
jgi:hypothetical protein